MLLFIFELLLNIELKQIYNMTYEPALKTQKLEANFSVPKIKVKFFRQKQMMMIPIVIPTRHWKLYAKKKKKKKKKVDVKQVTNWQRKTIYVKRILEDQGQGTDNKKRIKIINFDNTSELELSNDLRRSILEKSLQVGQKFTEEEPKKQMTKVPLLYGLFHTRIQTYRKWKSNKKTQAW